MKVAVLGCGGLGHVHARIYAGMEEVSLTAVCDIDAGRADRLAEELGVAAYADFRDMLEEAEFDVISIAVPSWLHHAYAVQAARAGKHVICEKPIALTAEDARDMIDVCEANGVRLFIGHVVRFFPDYVHLKQTLDNGAIGKPGVAHASRKGGHPAATHPWYADEAKSGGVIVDLMIHDLDFLRWSFGEVARVYGMVRNEELLEYALVTLEFESGAVANVEAYWGYPGQFQTKAELAGSGGIVQTSSLDSSSVRVHRRESASENGPFVAIPGSPSFHSPYELELKHFIACIRGEAEPAVTAQDALRALEIALAAKQSSQTGHPVQLAPAAQGYHGGDHR
ncbi:Gfo/Idh/MocA family protein [Paenibacillus methanolicus]|uniref:Putative dehydrogenase n=1 Tax=Paenibacillus methanolicus TaxID=582686 RepID=A0A5S5CIU0_9BACL|nr:Gfo/Idh/MocA family oxidoreductase [Paenibacillus methanolicus]TYP79716.1 putative dehydrogenase [Paenibacillus methanolicus]